MTDETLLILSEIGLPLYSARGLTESLAPIGVAADLVRLSNGDLDDWSYEGFNDKLSLRISCTDQRSPALLGVPPGLPIQVVPVTELCYLQSGGTAQKQILSGSERVENGFVFYRPVLQMRLRSVTASTNEWGATVGWDAELEEI